MRQAPFDPRQQPQGYYNQGQQVYYQQPPLHPAQFNQGQPLPAPPQLQMQANFQQAPQRGQYQQQEGPIPVYIQEDHQQYYDQQRFSGTGQNYQNHGQQQQQGDEEDGYGSQDQMQMQNQQVIMFWEHKFYTIFERFQIIHDKVDWLRNQFYGLNNELKAVDSEAEWNDAKEHHDDFMEHLEEFSQQLAGAMNQNASLLEQREMEGEASGAWKQRYYELFESFKAMEQQLNQVNEGRAQGVDEQFMENYRLLEREYTKVSKQLDEIKKGQQPKDGNEQVYEYREKLDYALQEAQKYKEMLDQLHEENQQMNAEIEHLKQNAMGVAQQQPMQQGPSEEDYAEFKTAMEEKQYQINQLTAQLQEYEEKFNYMSQTYESKIAYSDNIEQQLEAKNAELSEIKNKMMETDNRYKMVQQSIEEYQRMIKNKNTEIQDREDEIHRVKRQLLSTSNKKNTSQTDLLRKEYDTRVKKIEQEYEQKITMLKKKIKQKQEQTQNAALTQIKLQSQEKKNKMLIEQIQSLAQQLHDREKDIVEMKRIAYQYDKLKNIQYQYQGAIEEKEQLNAALLQKNYDIDSLQGQINDFETRIRDLSDKTFSTNSKSFINQIQELNNLIQSKESEVNKYKSSVNIKETYIVQLQTELQKTKNILVGNERNFEREKDTQTEIIKHLERKNTQLQRKMRDLEYQYGSQMRRNLEEEIRNLRHQNQARQQNIIRLESEELQLRSRITHYQRIRASHSGDVEQLTNRIKQLETSKSEMIRKVQTSYREVKKREKENKQLIQNQKNLKQKVTNLLDKINETEKLISQKQKIIEQLEQQLSKTNTRLNYITGEHDQLRLRRRDQTDLFLKESDDLKKKLFDLEYKNNQGNNAGKMAQYGKIQSQMIQQLTEEKEFLKAELATALQELGHLPDFSKKQNSIKKSRASEGIDFIQKRLFDFNSKLDKMIIKNRQLNEQTSRGFGSNIENWNNTFSGSSAHKNYEEEVKTLKNQLQQLRKYCAKLEVEAEGETAKMNPKHSIVFIEQEKTYNDKIQFYQSQISTLENRVQSLIEVNTMLKDRVDAILRGDSSTSAAALYKEQLSLAEETISNLNSKIKKLQQENRNYKLNNNQSTTKLCRQYQNKIFECENKIFNLERRINNLEMEKSKIENDRASLSRNLHICQSQLESLKNSSRKSNQNLQKTNKQLNEQSLKLENEIAQMLNKVRMLQSDNKRLTQALNSQQQIFMSPFKNSSYKNSPQVLSPSKFEK